MSTPGIISTSKNRLKQHKIGIFFKPVSELVHTINTQKEFAVVGEQRKAEAEER